jgi:hypothetical protein
MLECEGGACAGFRFWVISLCPGPQGAADEVSRLRLGAKHEREIAAAAGARETLGQAGAAARAALHAHASR